MSDTGEAGAARKDMDTLQNNAVNTVTLFDGSEVAIHKCKVRQLGVVSDFLAEALKAMGIDTIDGAMNIDLNSPQIFIGLFQSCLEPTVAVLASLSDKSEEEILDMDIDDMVAILTGVFTVNKDFFSNRVLPSLAALLPKQVSPAE